MSQRGKLQFHGQLDRLFKTIMEKLGMVLSEITEHPEVGTVHLGDIHEG